MCIGRVSPHGTFIPPRFDLAGPFTIEGAIACIADQCWLLDKNGSFITPTWNRQSGPFSENYSEGLASANKDGQWGYVDRARSVVIPFQFKYAGQFDQGMANLIPPKYDDVYPFSDGLAPVELAGSGVTWTGRAMWSFQPNTISATCFRRGLPLLSSTVSGGRSTAAVASPFRRCSTLTCRFAAESRRLRHSRRLGWQATALVPSYTEANTG